MRCRKIELVGAAVLALVGCKNAAESEAPASPVPPSAPPAAAAPAPAPAPATESGVIRTGLTSLKEAPDAKGKWKATLMRGEKVTVLDKDSPGFVHVRLSDGGEGYVDDSAVLSGEVEEVLVLDDKPLYERPDSAALRSGTVKLGTLLFILRDKEGWVEVQLPKGRTGWMAQNDVTRDPTELTVARNLFRHELLKDAKQTARQEQAAQILSETIQQYPDSKVLKASGLVPGDAPAEAPPDESAPNADTAAPGAAPAEDINAVEPPAAPAPAPTAP